MLIEYQQGSKNTDMLSYLPCRKKMTIDIREPFSGKGVEGILGDYLEVDLSGLDVIACFQVLEHIDDDRVGEFAKKLLSEARITVVSVPYVWPEGSCKWHKQDPVDVEKLIGWFGKSPALIHVVKEDNNSHKNERLIAVFVKDYDPEIDLEYWRKHAESRKR